MTDQKLTQREYDALRHCVVVAYEGHYADEINTDHLDAPEPWQLARGKELRAEKRAAERALRKVRP